MASTGTPTSALQRETQLGKSNMTKDGSIVTSSDPTISPSATAGQKLKGDASGALKGSIGSMQAAAGAATRNKGLEEKGRVKMQEEDERLGAKRGHMPVGSDQRHVEVEKQQ
ncbi:hypothetical protein F4820DRAFT_451573 [Hypoxylon rubiginosum]|uniref:Uncharacterized protein n=1 Tax=Hypoxylon rubiginosum TaxID=110542 RepID=A0ACB9YS60_9PEZI|nr:hypothetical protein F4820DRAFT_451573 [Hypoxylon rubiginosum]